MSNLKCPFCQQELKKHLGGDMPEVWCCDNEKCKLQMIGGDIELWQELIRTRKALDVAVDVLKEIDELLSSNKFDVREVPLLNITQTKISMLLKCINIEQITALERKEHFADASKKMKQKDVK